MDREETMKAAECLRRIDVEGYGLGFHELVAAGAVKAYLCGFPRQEALGMLSTVFREHLTDRAIARWLYRKLRSLNISR